MAAARPTASAMAIQDALAGLGVRETLIKLVGYEASTADGRADDRRFRQL